MRLALTQRVVSISLARELVDKQCLLCVQLALVMSWTKLVWLDCCSRPDAPRKSIFEPIHPFS